MMNYLLWKRKRSTKKIQQTQTTTEDQLLIRTRTKKYLKYFFALILGTLFYSFEFIPNFSDREYGAEKQVKEAKKINAIALSKVKEYAKGSQAYQDYIKANNQKKEVFKHYNSVIEEEKVFGFNSFQLFWERFGLFLGFFIYALHNLFQSFYFERKNLGNKVLHGFIISVCMFYFFWIFQKFQDFSKVTYYLMTFASAGIVVLAVYLITKYQDHCINKLKETVSRLAAFSFLHTKQEKKPEMLELFK